MKKPNLSRIAPLAEIVSSLAIIVSLIYAGYEYNRSTTLNNRDVDEGLYKSVWEMERLLIENPDMARIVLTALEYPEELLPEEQLRYLAYEHIFYDSWESAWNYHQQGILEAENWESWNTWFRTEFLKKPRLSWVGNRKHYAGDFLEYLDSLDKVDR